MQENTPAQELQQQQRRLRGFAAMSPEKKKEIAGMGGRAAHASGRAHQFSSEEARAAGKKRHQRVESPN
jgi:general stress protein YciG